MKKSLVALAVLGSFVGAASAASSVTLYGIVEAAYQNKGHDGKGLMQDAGNESRLGFKGTEDLGNGTAAFFHFEAGFDSSVGSFTNGKSDMFNEKSLVGLSFANGAHKVYFGRSASPIDRIGFSTDHLSSGLGWKSSAGNWQNAAFYDYSANGLTVMAAVTTKAGAAGNSTALLNGTDSVLYPAAAEGHNKGRASYGVAVKYEGSNWAVGAGYQRDNGQVDTNGGGVNGVGDTKYEWGVGGKYTFNPVTFAASYAHAKLTEGQKERRIHSTISAALTPNDTIFVNYLNDKINWSGVTTKKETRFGFGYIHALSKRTELFGNVGRVREKISDTRGTSWDVGVRHRF